MKYSRHIWKSFFFLSYTFVILCVVFSAINVYFLWLPALLEKKVKPEVPVYPNIKNPIACPDNEFVKNEYEKRSKGNLWNPTLLEKYVGLYSNKWIPGNPTQKFNVLKDGKVWSYGVEKLSDIQKDPLNKLSGTSKKFNPPSYQSDIENFVENIDYSTWDIQVTGNGYGFLGDTILNVATRADFQQGSTDCFDSGRREVKILLSERKNGIEYSIPIYSPDNPTMYFSAFDPQYCSVYSFLDTGGNLFMVCLSEKLSESESQFVIMGYSFVRNEKGPNYSYLVPILLTYVADPVKANATSSTFRAYNTMGSFGLYFDIWSNNGGEYFLLSPSKIVHIAPNEAGYLSVASIYLFEPNLSQEPYSLVRYTFSMINKRYLIFSSSKGGAVFDTETKSFLNIDNSCYVTLPDSDHDFLYNESLDPFLEHSNKNLGYKYISDDSFEIFQYVISSGCVINEGQMDVIIKDGLFRCESKILGTKECSVVD